MHQSGRKLRSSGQSDGIFNQPKPRFLVIPSLLYCKNNERTSFLHILAGGPVSFPQSLRGKSSGGQVTFKKYLSYFTSVTCKSNSLLLIRYPFFIVTVPLQLVVTDILNVTKLLLVTTKSN
jgi:hypothetical protein